MEPGQAPTPTTSLPQQLHLSRISATQGSQIYAGVFHNTLPHSARGDNCADPPSPSSTVPFRRDPHFVDRGDTLKQIDQRCSQPAGRAALVGLGGVGKSQLAIEYAYRVREQSPQTWVFWVHAGSQARFAEGYRRIAEATKIPGLEDLKADVLRLVRSWLCDQPMKRWVIVVDNADDPKILFAPYDRIHAQEAQVSDQSTTSLLDFLPQSPKGSILFTSRNRDAAYRLTGDLTDIIDVGPMNEIDAQALFKKKFPQVAHDQDLLALVNELECIPLAITQAAAHIAQRSPRVTAASYLQTLQRGEREILHLLDSDLGDLRRDGKASNSVIATWQISFEHIRKEKPSATRLLSLMSLFDRQAIPESLLISFCRENEDVTSDFDDDLLTLMNFCLVSLDLRGNQFGMHRLVQLSTRSWLQLGEELEDWKETFVRFMLINYPEIEDYENWGMCDALFPHAQALTKSRPLEVSSLTAWVAVLNRASWYAMEVKNYEAAYEMSASALTGIESVSGLDKSIVSTNLRCLGVVLKNQRKYEEAVQAFQRALNTAPEGSPRDSLMMNLAATYVCQGRWTDAEELWSEILASHTWTDPQKGMARPAMEGSISLFLFFIERCKEAEIFLSEAVSASRERFGQNHPKVLSFVHYLAIILRRKGQSDKAMPLITDCVEQRRRVLGEDDPDYQRSLKLLTEWRAKDQTRAS